MGVMAFDVKVLCDSISPEAIRLTTLQVTIPRIVLSEFNTHRVFSRNSASSRAIPIEKRIAAVKQDPFIPLSFGRNTKGMQAKEELESKQQQEARQVWLSAMDQAIEHAEQLSKLDVHKQLANRLIEPFCWQTIIVSATEWKNFFALRCSKDAQPEIMTAAYLMRGAMQASSPKTLTLKDWHLPLLNDKEQLLMQNFSMEELCMISVGRCARVSYLTHDGKRDPQADIELAQRLRNSGHMSPFEHVAQPSLLNPRGFNGNFRGWTQLRKTIRNEDNYQNVLDEENEWPNRFTMGHDR